MNSVDYVRLELGFSVTDQFDEGDNYVKNRNSCRETPSQYLIEVHAVNTF